jgi:hypothetical protein
VSDLNTVVESFRYRATFGDLGSYRIQLIVIHVKQAVDHPGQVRRPDLDTVGSFVGCDSG